MSSSQTGTEVWIVAGVLACSGAAFLLWAWPSAHFNRLRGGAGVASVALACFLLGAAAADMRVASVAAPRLNLPSSDPVMVSGWVQELERGQRQSRLILLVQSIEGVERAPRLVSVATPDQGAYAPGQAASCRAVLQPPAGPIAPRAYDSARSAYFARIGGSGFTLGACRPAELPAPTAWGDRVTLTLAALRRDLTETIYEASPSEGGAVAAALITGDMSLISRQAMDWYRNSGLGHLLSVSGLHMSLVAGGIYAVLHLVFALVPGLALRAPVRKWAAVAGLLSGGIYLLISGASVPAQRAYIMAGVAFVAILLDRPAITMRGLGVAMIFIVLTTPEAVLQPGFQMSFAATAALVAAFEGASGNRTPTGQNLGRVIGAMQASGGFIAGMALASLVAGLATDAIAAAHFQRLTAYGLIANIVAGPIITFVVTPAAFLSLALAPFGLSQAGLVVMSAALGVVTEIARVFADRPEALIPLTPAPKLFLGLALAAIAWVCIWRGLLRWLALAPALCALGLYFFQPPVLAVADADLRVILARDAQTWRMAAPKQGGAFLKERLGQMVGLIGDDLVALAPASCDEHACRWSIDAKGSRAQLVFARDSEGLNAACTTGAIVFTREYAPPGYVKTCGVHTLIDARDLARNGGIMIRGDVSGLVIERAAPHGANKPWSGRLTRNVE